ncbi:MAG TPA: hypothetical protein VGN11_10490 [Candidatus Baltobacteraceae bacterium]|jgi:hypothetical protein|nr:hypothetical protein [Candidatus Baltobacteraceae bacterium]
MNFELIDRYLLDGTPARADVVAALLSSPSDMPAARPFYEGMKMLGARTPDLTLIALRLVLAGKRADDAAVIELRGLIDRSHGTGPRAEEARASYHQALARKPEQE